MSVSAFGCPFLQHWLKICHFPNRPLFIYRSNLSYSVVFVFKIWRMLFVQCQEMWMFSGALVAQSATMHDDQGSIPAQGGIIGSSHLPSLWQWSSKFIIVTCNYSVTVLSKKERNNQYCNGNKSIIVIKVLFDGLNHWQLCFVVPFMRNIFYSFFYYSNKLFYWKAYIKKAQNLSLKLIVL